MSTQMRLPSALGSAAPSSRAIMASGIWTPATLARIQRAVLAEAIGPTPTRMKHRWSSPMSRACAMNRRKSGRSKQYCVWMNCAPAAIFFASLSTRKSYGGANGFSAAPMNTLGGVVSLRPERNRLSSRIIRMTESSEIEVEIEDGLGLRVVAALHAVAGEAEHVADVERSRAQNRALDRDAVIIAAGDLQHRRIADAGQDGADGDARHVAMRARAVGGVDAVDPALVSLSGLAYVVGVGRIGRAELRGDREFATPQHALEPTPRRMPRQFDERRGRIEADVVRVRTGKRRHASAFVRSRARLSHVDEPLRAWFSGGRTSAMPRPPASRGCPRRP